MMCQKELLERADIQRIKCSLLLISWLSGEIRKHIEMASQCMFSGVKPGEYDSRKN